MLDIFATPKKLEEQTTADKMYLLRQVAYQMLGTLWNYYRKIKKGDEGFELFKGKTIMEQMKATQSALRFSSRSAKKAYRATYLASVKDITRSGDIKKDTFPVLPEVVGDQEPPSLTSEFDEVIICWTPVKFFLPAKQIREKGTATQRHTEGLIAKLFFKVAGYYASAENWDEEKLTFYIKGIKPSDSFQDIAVKLEPLKTDLATFVSVYEPFKFGEASLKKDASQEGDTFDDAMGVESFESQVTTLYWHNFIYMAVELFFFRYYLTLISSTESVQAIRYLTTLFEPVFQKAIINKGVFLGSFETDRSKSKFRKAFLEYKQKRLDDPPVTKMKTKKGVFEVYSYNLSYLEKTTVGFELSAPLEEDSEWARFLKFNIFSSRTLVSPVASVSQAEQAGKPSPETVSSEHKLPTISPKDFAMMSILSSLVKCTEFRRQARHEILNRFKKRALADKELAEKRITEIRKQGEKKIKLLERKAAKIKRMKQTETGEMFDKDVVDFKQKLETSCLTIQQNAQQQMNLQKNRLKTLFEEIAKEDSVSSATSAKTIMKLATKIDKNGSFGKRLLSSASQIGQEGSVKELEPFFKNIFFILEPSVQEKILLVQSMQKSGLDQTLHLSLDEKELKEQENQIHETRIKIEKSMPGIFENKLLFLTSMIPIEDLFRISIDNSSLKTLLRLKTMSPKGGKPALIPGPIIKALLYFNTVRNPVPKNNLILNEKESERDIQKAINSALLNRLLASLK